MAKKPTPLAAIDITSEMIEEQIKKSITAAQKNLPRFMKARTAGKPIPKSWIEGKVKDAYDYKTLLSSLKSEIKKLKRGLGGIILTDPEHYRKTGLFQKIADNVKDPAVWGRDLFRALGSWDSKMHDFAGSVVKGKVGHHRTALSILRDALEPLDIDIRKEFKALALKNGYKVGEEFVDYIDPAAHKAFTKAVTGKLAEKLGIDHVSKATAKHKELFAALTERAAHAAAFGSETGLWVPKELIKKGATAEEVFNIARPYLELARRGADAGLELDKIISSDNWNTTEELLELVKKVEVQDTTPIQNAMRRDLYNAGFIDESGFSKLRKGREVVKSPQQLGQTIEQTLSNVWEPVDARGLRGLTRQIEPVTESGQVLFSKTNDLSDAVKPVGGGVAALTADSFAPTGYNKLTEQAQKVGNKLVEAKDAANLKQLSTIGKRAAMLNPLMFGASTGLGALALQDRIKEVAANPDDPWLKFQLRLDQTALGADATGLTSSAAALTGWGALVPAAAEITSNVASGASLALDFGRWVKDPEAREDTLEWWTSVYQRGSRGLIKGLQQVF